MSQSTTMTIRLDHELKTRLDQLAAATHRSKSFLASEAVRKKKQPYSTSGGLIRERHIPASRLLEQPGWLSNLL